MVFTLSFVSQGDDVLHAVPGDPRLTIPGQFIEMYFRQTIGLAPSDEMHLARLLPMGSIAVRDGQLCVPIEEDVVHVPPGAPPVGVNLRVRRSSPGTGNWIDRDDNREALHVRGIASTGASPLDLTSTDLPDAHIAKQTNRVITIAPTKKTP